MDLQKQNILIIKAEMRKNHPRTNCLKMSVKIYAHVYKFLYQ